MEGLAPQERELVSHLLPGPIHIDDLSDRMGQSAGCVLALLTMLEVKGMIRRVSGGRFALSASEP